MRAYHGTVHSGLRILKPFCNPHSNLAYPCVYLSTNKALASIYIWNRPYKWTTFEISQDGIPVYDESFENGLYEFYHGVKGVIYSCEGEFHVDERTAISCAVVSRRPVPVSSEDIVEDAYERILQYEAVGLLRINHYDTLSHEQRRRDKSMVLGAIHRLGLLMGEHPLSDFVREKFPALWNEALLEMTVKKQEDDG